MNEPLHMIQADINVPYLHRWMSGRMLRDLDHAMHCLLTESFGKDLAPRPFHVILPQRGQTGCLYGYGAVGATELQNISDRCTDPLQSSVLPTSRILSKPVHQQWPIGKQLGFEIRVKPMRRIRLPHINGGRTVECDAWLMAQFGNDNPARPRELVYREWLKERFEANGAVQMIDAHVVKQRRVRSQRKRNGHEIDSPDVLMRGKFMINDSDAFVDLLRNGIGRHKAYGYGMVLIKAT